MSRWIVAPMIAILFACGGEEAEEDAVSADTVAEPGERVDGLQVRLVDSIPWRTELAEGVYRRVAVSRDRSVDTIPGVAVESRPVVVDDSILYGFAWADGEVRWGFRWTPGEGAGAIDLPEDFLSFTAFELAPDAAHLAYVGRARESTSGEIRLAAIVRTWPAGEVVHESHAVAGYPSDAKNSSVEWLSADSVDIRIRLDDLETPGGSWLRVTGAPSTGSFSADTVSGG